MIETKIIGFFYLLYTIFILFVISITSLEFWSILPSVLLMWLIFCFFVLGSKVLKKENTSNYTANFISWLNGKSSVTFIALMIITVLSSFLVVRFYTGQSFSTVINNIRNNVSTYAEYQRYFSENQVSQFSISKLPFVFMMAFVKFNLFYGFFSLSLGSGETEKLTIVKKTYLFFSALSYLYIGVARGTNFEMFEFVILIITLIFLRNDSKTFDIKKIFIILVITVLSVFIFIEVIGQRGSTGSKNFFISNDVFIDFSSPVFKSFEKLSLIFVSIYGYFGFGLFYGSVFLNSIYFSSTKSSLIYSLPLFPILFNEPDIKEKMREFIDLGARWNPDAYVLSSKVGILGLFFLVFLLGILLCQLKQSQSNVSNASDTVLSFFIIIQLLSFPVGNFITSATSSKIIIGMLILYKLFKALMGRYLY